MKNKPQAPVCMTLRLPPRLHQKLKKLAREKGMPLSALIVAWLWDDLAVVETSPYLGWHNRV